LETDYRAQITDNKQHSSSQDILWIPVENGFYVSINIVLDVTPNKYRYNRGNCWHTL